MVVQTASRNLSMCELELQFFCLTSSLKQRKHVRRGVTYFRIGVPADDDVNWAWCALAQDCVDIIQSHVVNHRVIDLHDLVPIAEGMKRKVKSQRAHKQNHHLFIWLLYGVTEHSGRSLQLLTLLYTQVQDVKWTETSTILSM